MLGENQFQSPFEGPSVGNNDLNYHVIVTDHPYMAEIGLSAFTTGQLYEWMKKVDSKNNYVNLKIFGFDNKKPDDSDVDFNVFFDAAQTIFGYSKPSTSEISRFNFLAWRFRDRGGEYIPYVNTLFSTNNNWKYDKYTYKNLQFNEFNQKHTVIPDLTQSNPEISLSEQNNLDNGISNLIEMNNYFRYRAMTTPKSMWDDVDKARSEFILDIKSSFEKCITWSGIVPFHLNLNTKTVGSGAIDNGCKKEEWVTYKLFLFDDSFNKQDARKVTMSELVFVSPKIDSFGRAGNKQNGEITPVSREINPKNNTAGSLDLQWNEFEGKWVSGTPQTIAMVATYTPAARIPGLDAIKNNEVLDLLSPEIQLQVTVGSAIPLNMQNGNPYQVAPDYKLTKDCRNQDPEKLMVRFYNRVPRAWNSGEIVILNKIDGVWQPTSYGEPTIEEVRPSFDGKWDFIYLMTNSDYFFINSSGLISDVRSKITNSNFEEGIRTAYYWYDGLNRPTNTGSIFFAAVDNGYFQVTSWDFMGPNIGGLRSSGNALSCTHWNFNPAGSGFLDEDDPYYYSDKSAPFFGCVFPEGYDIGEKFSLYNGEFASHPHLKSIGYYGSSDYAQFMTDVHEETIVFENKNANTAEGNGGGMFVKQNDPELLHLPADIALNCSPNGENGSTLKPIYPFKFLSWNYKINNHGLTFSKDIDDWFFVNDETQTNKQYRRGIWMSSGNRGINDYSGTAFDFKPISPGYISFRPLRAECYANFEFKQWNGGGQNSNSQEFWFYGNSGVIPANGKLYRGEYGARNWINISDKESPISLTALSRNSKNEREEKNSLIGDIWGLKYNIDLNKDSLRLPPNSARFSKTNWSRNWMHGDGNIITDFRPAGAVGIIASQCTVTATTSVNIECESLVGMDSWFFGGANPDEDWGTSWGGYQGGNYNNFQTTNLHVRMFHAWPRDLTIYDPRFFAVFHFNPGVGIADHNLNRERVYDWYNNGEKQDSPPAQGDIIGYPSNWYRVERSESIVDARVPTLVSVDSNGVSQTANYGLKVNKFTLRDRDDSNLDLRRRGKLLPYTADILTISIGRASGISDLVSYHAYKDDTATSPQDIDVVILCPGSGYSTNDRFTTIGGTGEEVLLKPIINNGFSTDAKYFINGVVGFEIISSGYNFNGQDFLDIDTIKGNQKFNGKITNVLNEEVPLTIKIVPTQSTAITSAGKGLEAGFSRGIINSLRVIDEKPKELYNNIQLRESSFLPVKTGSPVAPVIGNKNTELQIYEINENETFGLKNKYDLFFFFHNDISHTFSYGNDRRSGFSTYGSDPTSHEQHITINIVPN